MVSAVFHKRRVTLTVTDNVLASRSYPNKNQVLNSEAFDQTGFRDNEEGRGTGTLVGFI
ncbi:hypothetical protein ACFL9S_16095 [Erwinia sp. AnSW2-5]|uniref:hypothetical protein n=1 Tax=Erwinia sp. AnSW2-5 TaxID=3367692 RepID=UPI00385E460C